MRMDCKTVYISILAVGGAAADAVIGRQAQEADRRHAAARRQAAAQRRSLLARCLLRDLLQRTTGIAGHAWDIAQDAAGRPRAAHPHHDPALAVSISHSGAYAAVAATRLGAVGIDIERHDPERAMAEIAEMAFGPDIAEVREAGAFYRLWCLREAAGKAAGGGLSAAIDLKALTQGAPATGAWRGGDAERSWLLAHLEPVSGYSLAVALLPADATAAASWSLASLSWQPADDDPT
jgi:phosphopantetheinyl transferase